MKKTNKQIVVDKVIKEVEKDFFKRLNLRFQSQYQMMNLQRFFVLDWFNDNFRKYSALAVPDKDMKKWTDKMLISQFSDVLVNQMFAPTAKTKFGKWLVKKICKYL